MSALGFVTAELQALEAQGLRRRLRSFDGPQGPEAVVDGRAVLCFSSNDYLGLAASPELVAAAERALATEGFGAGSSRLIAGNGRAHRSLERALSAFHEGREVLLFNSGYQANVGVLSAIAGPGDVIFSDALNHASLIDGCRLSRAKVEVFPHRDIPALRRMLESIPARRRFVVTDALFSMDGHHAPIRELRAVCDRAGAVLVVDEAHAIGVLGPGGRGLCAELAVEPNVLVGTLGKAFGAFGAYVAGSSDLIEILFNRARSFVFSTALPPSVAAAAEAALDIVRSSQGDARRSHLFALITRFLGGLRALEIPAPATVESPIVPLLIGDPARTMAVTERLLSLGIYAQGIRPPTVPERTARLRFSITAAHRPEHVERALEALATVRNEGLLVSR